MPFSCLSIPAAPKTKAELQDTGHSEPGNVDKKSRQSQRSNATDTKSQRSSNKTASASTAGGGAMAGGEAPKRGNSG